MHKPELKSWPAGPDCPLGKAVSDIPKAPKNTATSSGDKKYKVAHTTLMLSRGAPAGMRGKLRFYGLGRKLSRLQKLSEALLRARATSYNQPISIAYHLARDSLVGSH